MYRDYKHKYEWLYGTHNKIKCIAYSNVMVGDRIIPVKGEGLARCHPKDLYNEEFGRELAKIRAKRQLCQKIENVFMAESMNKSHYKHPNFHIAEDMLYDRGLLLDDIGTNLIARVLDNATIARRIKYE